MAPVTLSSKYQIVIPREIRESMGLRAGTKFELFAIGGVIEMVPVRPIQEMRGRFKGIDTNVERDEDRI